eukprot:4120053-Prymnesium_polylepis.1
MRASRAHGCGHASARPAHGSDDSSAAASAAASAALHSGGRLRCRPARARGRWWASARTHAIALDRLVTRDVAHGR